MIPIAKLVRNGNGKPYLNCIDWYSWQEKTKIRFIIGFWTSLQIPIWEVCLNFKFANRFHASIWQTKLGCQDDELVWDVKMIHWLGMPRWQVSLRCQDQHVVGMLRWKVDLDLSRIWKASFLYLTSYFGTLILKLQFSKLI